MLMRRSTCRPPAPPPSRWWRSPILSPCFACTPFRGSGGLFVATPRPRPPAWVGAPAGMALIGLDAHAPTNVAAAGTAALGVVAIAYSMAVLRLHDLTGEGRFF